MGNSKVRLKTPSSAAFYAQKNVLCSQVSLTSIPIPLPMPVSKIKLNTSVKISYLASF